MRKLLRWVSEQRPWRIFAAFALLSIGSAPLGASRHHPVLLMLAGITGVLCLFGYPFLIIFGFPKPYSTASSRGVALAAAVVLGLAVVTSMLELQIAQLSMPGWWQPLVCVPVVALVYAPFFLATAIIDNARRAVGQYKVLDFIGTWICVLGYPVWGVFFIQRSIASTLAILDSRIGVGTSERSSL